MQIDDCTFHRCVRLGKFDSDRTITFVPPDGEFELMRYRVTGNIALPFRLVPAVQESGKTKLSVTLKATATFGSTKFASNVVIKFPVNIAGREVFVTGTPWSHGPLLPAQRRRSPPTRRRRTSRWVQAGPSSSPTRRQSCGGSNDGQAVRSSCFKLT